MIHHAHMASAQDLFGQLWKEYALSDSRYMTSDTLVLCMETMTVLLWGPLCFVVASMIAARHSLRHPVQLLVCMSHLYGDTLYYATSLVEDYAKGRPSCRPEPYYFWVYYFFMNFIWIVVPACMSFFFFSLGFIWTLLTRTPDYIYDSITTISAVMQRLEEGAEERKAQ